mmetsp:Transcript_39007/g.124148  ORF Transcript_39007/g.124148 Transcript_39007/m.124148 type:complete len:878 (+) Transcript_39007:125-2758(+)
MSAMPFTIRPSGPALAPARGASARSASRTVHVTAHAGRESAAWQRRERQLGSVARVATPSDDRTFRFAVDPSNLRRARLNIRAKAVSGGEPSPPGSSSSESAGARLLAAERRLLDLFIPGKDPPKASAVAMLREEIDLLRKHASAEAEENRAAASQASAQAALSPEELIKQKSEEMNRIMQENAKLREKAAAKAMSGLSDAEKAEVERLKAENDKLRLKAEAVAKSVAPPRPAAAAPPPPAAKAAPASAAMAAREAAVEDARREQEEAEALARKFAAERDANLAKQGADEAMLADLEARVRGDLAGLGELVEDAPAPAAPPPPPPAATAPPPAPEPVVDEDDAIAEKEAMDLIERIQAQAAAKANEAIAYAEATAPDKELTAKQKAMAAEVTRMKEENAKLKAMAEAAANPKAAPAAAPANPEDPRARAAADIAAQAAQAKKEAEAANLKAGADKLSAAQAAHAAAAGAAVAAAAEERALSAKLEVDAKNKAESHKQKAQAEAALAAAQAKAKKDSEELARLAEEKKRMEKLKAEAKIKEEKEILALEEENRKLKAMADKVAAKKAAEKAAIEAEEAKAAAEELASAEAAEAMAAAAAEAKAAMAAAAQAAADAAAEPAAAAPDAIPEGEDPEVTAKKAKQAALQAKMAAIMEENAELREKSQASKEGAAAPAAPAPASSSSPAWPTTSASAEGAGREGGLGTGRGRPWFLVYMPHALHTCAPVSLSFRHMGVLNVPQLAHVLPLSPPGAAGRDLGQGRELRRWPGEPGAEPAGRALRYEVSDRTTRRWLRHEKGAPMAAARRGRWPAIASSSLRCRASPLNGSISGFFCKNMRTARCPSRATAARPGGWNPRAPPALASSAAHPASSSSGQMLSLK